ncbi:hypothetical protein Tco_1497685 [Tanacetum coccineum]
MRNHYLKHVGNFKHSDLKTKKFEEKIQALYEKIKRFEDYDGILNKRGNEQSDFWSGQQEWIIVRWRLYESCGVCILEFEDGIVISMLVERRYPLSKDLLQWMLYFDLGLEVERESSVALDLIRFIKQQIDEE